MQVKIAQMSDLHYSAATLEESERCFSSAVAESIAQKIDCAIITGDTSDHHLDAHSPALQALGRQIQRLADFCPVLLLQGTFSHEPPGFLRTLSMLKSFHPIVVADKIGSFGLTATGFERFRSSGAYKAVFHCLPTMNKADIVAMSVEGEVHEQAREIIANILQGWKSLNQRLRTNGIPTMILSHGTVFDSISEHGVPMAGADHELGLGSLFAAEACGVALGHIHKCQDWRETSNGINQIVSYAGSIGRFHFGEDNNKSWSCWEVDASGATLTRHPTPASKAIDLHFEGPPDLSLLQAQAQLCAGADVRIRYAVDEESRAKVDREALREILKTAGAGKVQIEGRTLIVQRQRAKGISTAGMAEKLSMWCETTATVGVDALQTRLDALQQKDPIEIATQFLNAKSLETT